MVFIGQWQNIKDCDIKEWKLLERTQKEFVLDPNVSYSMVLLFWDRSVSLSHQNSPSLTSLIVLTNIDWALQDQ